ncbi:UDP-N-acetylmuramate:L-alanyl-gamma-D-glutamyl-meso-diaminopimelate ligase [Pseudomonas fragi]|uniref:UDP-N-acetylmuramate:L-alanyl-gamma-D-glutamyl-meso-diaminopimelate ligase n=1 Tax=Pseudomonas fragi TaxID=296 RepID=A0A449IMN1_PSEFR|nr:UDP-N-acetylmuramate:L-alanyl-gamma-D-glutamyl-meso-diaminopimelate ligase [Pseudomonas fragi]
MKLLVAQRRAEVAVHAACLGAKQMQAIELLIAHALRAPAQQLLEGGVARGADQRALKGGQGLRKHIGDAPLIAVIEPRSNSMKLGAHRDGLPQSVVQADHVVWYAPANLGWDLAATVASSPVPTKVCDSLDAIIAEVKAQVKPGTHVVIMSNGGFGGLHGKLAEALQ